MPIQLVPNGALPVSANNGQDVVLPLPSMSSGDQTWIVGGHGYRSSAINGPITTGYIQHYLRPDVGLLGGDPMVGCWSKTMGATPDASVSLPGSSSGQDSVGYLVFCLIGVDGTNPLDVAIAASDSLDPPARTIVTAGAWVIAFAAAKTTASWSVLPGYSNFVSVSVVDTNRLTIAACTKEIVSPSAEDPAAFDVSTSSPHAFAIVLRPASAPAPADDTSKFFQFL